MISLFSEPVPVYPEELYVALCHDRHEEPEVRVFLDGSDARIWILSFMTECVAHPDHLRFEQVDGFEHWLSYLPESDYAFVKKVILVREEALKFADGQGSSEEE